MKRRTGIAFAFSALAVFLTLSSAAFACTWIQGTMTASGNGGTGISTAIGDGGPDNGFGAMEWCSRTGTATAGRPGLLHIAISPYAGDPTSTNPQCVPASKLPDSDTLKGPGSGNPLVTPVGDVPNVTCNDPVLGCSGAPSIYTVTYTTVAGGPVKDADGNVKGDCMNRLTNNAVTVPDTHQANLLFQVKVTVDGSGVHYTETDNPEFRITNGSGSGDYRISATTPFSGGLCVSDVAGGRGNQVNLTVV